MPNSTSGTATLALNGQNYQLAGDFSYSVSNMVRESQIGIDGVHGYKQTPRAGRIEATLRNSDGLSLSDLGAMTNVTVTVILANGKTVIGRNMWVTDAPVANAVEGTIPMVWEGLEVLEV